MCWFRADPRRVFVAQLTGVGAGYGQAHCVSYEEAVAEVERELASAKVKPGSPAAVAVRTEAASPYAVDRPRRDEWWFPAAFEFLVGLGADEARPMRS
jgi:hypothetical protein